MPSVRLAPSILSADFARLGEAVAAIAAAGADLVHVDVMDGHFVPNISIGPAVVAAVKRSCDLPLDVHLMISQPERYVPDFVDAGADWVTVHAEASVHLHRLLTQIRESGAKVGLALNPLTPLAVLEAALPYLDQALVMSVNPGFGGQSFIPASVARVEAVKRMRDRINPNCQIEVDGGVNVKTAPLLAAAGADVLVAGSAVFGGHGTVGENIAALRAAANQQDQPAATPRG
ncbi:MAG TPA: ribulose-phosphate 3-epimerase [Trueperaceae bacterium]|nr:ribulose-phosphate 3-epimerase [Trueperaceae bacterium]